MDLIARDGRHITITKLFTEDINNLSAKQRIWVQLNVIIYVSHVWSI